MRACVYTTLYGAWDRLPEQPVRSGSAVDFIAFVGDPAVTSNTWQVRHVPPLLPDDFVRSSRFAKLLPHRLLPDYDMSLYIDCTVRLEQTPEALFRDLLTGQTETMACFSHPDRTDVLAEAEAIIDLGLEDPAVCLTQMAAYRRAGFMGGAPLIWGGLLIRYQNNPAVVDCMERWFAHVLRYSRRDQLAFPFVAEQLAFKFVAHPYAATQSPWHSWPHPRDRRRAGARVGLHVAQPPSPDRLPADLAALAAGWQTARDDVDGLKAALVRAKNTARKEAAAARSAWRAADEANAALRATQSALDEADAILHGILGSRTCSAAGPLQDAAEAIQSMRARLRGVSERATVSADVRRRHVLRAVR